MNVLLIPSWYPHRCYPLEGIYVRDQAMALGETRPDWGIGIARWGQGRNVLTRGHLIRSRGRCLAEALVDRRRSERALRANVIEWTRPALLLSERHRLGNGGRVLASVRDAARRMAARFGSVDLLHAHVSYPGGWAAMHLARERGVPYAITEHMGPFPVPVYRHADGALADYIREPLAAADARIAVSHALADAIAAHGLERPDVVPNVVDERVYDATRAADPAHFTFFTLGLMVRSKGVQDLLEAAARMLPTLAPDERARVRFRIAGTGPDLEAFRAAGHRLGLDPHLVWIDRVLTREQARDEFARCDAYVMASHHESFGIVLIEAMASGRPSVATRCGGPESILDADTGVLVPVGDHVAMAAALARMVREARGYDRARIRAAFERRYGRAAVADALEAVYARALERRRERPRLSAGGAR